MKNKIFFILIIESLSVLNSQEVSFTDLLPKSKRIHQELFFHGNFSNEIRISRNEDEINVDSDVPLIIGTLKSQFEKITEEIVVPPGTKLVNGRLIDNNVEMAR